MITTERRSYFEIAGMHCDSCVQRIRAALESVTGVVEARVTLTPPQATVTRNTSVTDGQLQNAVRSAGEYQLKPTTDEPASSTPVNGAHPAEATPRESLYPLLLIVGFIAGVTLLVAIRSRAFAVTDMMSTFMAGFFIVFGFFKLLDLPGFVGTFRTYDLLAKAVPPWGWVYPFVELALGVLYLLRVTPAVTNILTLVLMLLGAVGVGRALANKQRIRCACLGTVLNLPMTTVTLVEDLGMAAMAGAMLILMQTA